MNIEKILKEYKANKAYVETTLDRIATWKYALLHPELWEKEYVPKPRELGMPGAPLRNTSSPVERFITQKELDEETIKQWIKDDESRIFMKRLETQQIEKALDCLTKQERFVIESKYFENIFWRDIERNFNNQFRQQNFITISGLRKVNIDALKKLESILIPFYDSFKIA